MEDKIYCFYHRGDFDGQCSAAIAISKFGADRLIMMPWEYGERFPFGEIDLRAPMIVMDLIFPYEDFERLIREKAELDGAHPLIWIDHHKSAIEWVEDNGLDQHLSGLWRVGESACELAWRFFYTDASLMPEAVRLLGRYDVWDHSDPQTLPFQYGMRDRPSDPAKPEDYASLWAVLLECSLHSMSLVMEIIDQGERKYQATLAYNAKFAADAAFETEFEGMPAIAMNKLYTNSLAFESVYDPTKHRLMVAFGWRKGEWKISLYSDQEEIDCSALAKARGGGGHKGAAGFQCSELPFELK